MKFSCMLVFFVFVFCVTRVVLGDPLIVFVLFAFAVVYFWIAELLIDDSNIPQGYKSPSVPAPGDSHGSHAICVE